MANRPVKLKNRGGDYLYPYTDNIPTASISVAGKVKLDASPTSGSDNAITSGAVYSALAGKLAANGTASKATADANGNDIAATYATKTELTTVKNSVPVDGNLVHKSGNETIAGTKTFSASPILPTPAVGDSSTKGATTAYVNNKFKKVSALPANPDANTYYFIPE